MFSCFCKNNCYFKYFFVVKKQLYYSQIILNSELKHLLVVWKNLKVDYNLSLVSTSEQRLRCKKT